MDNNDEPRDPLIEAIEACKADKNFQVFLELLEAHYVYMACHTPGDPYQTAYLTGMRELAAMICGVDKRVRAMQNGR